MAAKGVQIKLELKDGGFVGKTNADAKALKKKVRSSYLDYLKEVTKFILRLSKEGRVSIVSFIQMAGEGIMDL